MAGELEKMCAMVAEGGVELQCAAARVLGALMPKEPAARKALVKGLKSEDESVRLCSLEALARIDGAAALPHLVPLLSGSEQSREQAVRILSSLGPDAAKALNKQLATADAQARRGAVEVLGQLEDVDTSDALFAALLDPDLDVVRKAAQAYQQRAERMSPADRSKAVRRVLEFMGSPRVKKIKTPLASCLSIVGALRDPAAARIVLAHVDRKQPPAVRHQALVALGALPLEGAVAHAATARVLPFLDEPDFEGIVKPALDVLWKSPPGPEQADRLLKLRAAAHPQVRLYALKALGAIGTAPAADALLEALWGAEPGPVEMAAASLRSNPVFGPLLVKALEREKDPTRAWKIANVLRACRDALDKATIRKFLSKCLDLLERRDTGFQVWFEVVRSAAPQALREALLRRGRDLLGKGKFDEAERCLTLLAREDLATPETDYALAVADLRRQRIDLSMAGRDRGPALFLFLKLARRENATLLKDLQRDVKLVSPRALLYLGFAFVERPEPERGTGAEILRFIAKKFGAKEEGKIAKQKLKTQGL